MLSFGGVSSLDTKLSRIQATSQMKSTEQNQYSHSNSYAYGQDSVQSGSNQETYQTYNSNGTMDKNEYNNRLVINSLDRMNSNPFSTNAQKDSYQFNKEVLGAYSLF